MGGGRWSAAVVSVVLTAVLLVPMTSGPAGSQTPEDWASAGLGLGEDLAPAPLGPHGTLGPPHGTGLGAAEVVYPNLGSQLSELAVATAAVGDAALGPSSDGGANGTGSVEALLLMLLLDGNRDGVLEFLADHGVTPANEVGDYLEVFLPPALLGPLAQQAGVSWVREMPPMFQERGDVAGQAARAHGALVWHANGFTGDGVKVGVIESASWASSSSGGKDGFTGLRALMGTDLPTTVVGRCYAAIGTPTSDLANCDTAGGQSHGMGVAESLMDVAPDADLYVANPLTWADLHSTVVWMHDQGVRVINYSQIASWHGAADGTSPFTPSPLNTVKWAVDNGITWVGAAGNRGTQVWYGAFTDSDGDGVHEWAADGTGPDEAQTMRLSEQEYAYIAVRWDDSWGGAARDLDLEVRYSATIDGTQTVVRTSADVQDGGARHFPHEEVKLLAPKTGFYHVYLKKKAASATPSWVQFRIMSRGLSSIDHYTDGGSIASPADSASPGALAVGAAHWDASGVLALESYSSRGPTPDGRTKPDVVGIGCGPVSTGLRHCGTSLATPHVTGLAALVIQRNPAFTPAQVAAYLRANAADHGDPGVDSLWGAGFAQLPPDGLTLPDIACTAALAGSGTVGGTWDQHCVSDARAGMFGRWYSFATDQQRSVTIEVSSALGTRVRLRRGGDAKQGPSLYATAGSAGSPARISAADLPADDYTIEVVSERSGRVGSFDLRVAGLPGAAAPLPVVNDDDPSPGYTIDPQVVARVEALAGQTQHGTEHVNRWNRVLVAFGVHDGAGVTGGAMTAAEAQQMANTHSSPVWDEVVAELSALEASRHQTLPPPTPQESAPVVSVSAVGTAVVEGRTAWFEISASPAPTEADAVLVGVEVTAADGVAADDSSLVWVTSGRVLVPVQTVNDLAAGAGGSVSLMLLAGEGYVLGADVSASVAVSDDDAAGQSGPLVEIASSADGVFEGEDAVFSVSVPAAVPAALSVSVEVSGTQVAGVSGGRRAVVIAAGETSAVLRVGTSDDAAFGGHGTVEAALASGSGYRAGLASVADVTVLDDDIAGFSVSAVSVIGGGTVSEGEQAVFTVSASPAPTWDVEAMVEVEVRDGDGKLVSARTETVAIPAGTTAATLRVAAGQDAIDNAGHGTVTAVITRGHRLDYRWGDPLTATVTVSDDDDLPPPVQDEADRPEDAVSAACAAGALPTLSISSPAASRSDATVDFEVSLSCVPSGRPMILLTPVRDGDIGENMFVTLSADQTTATVTVAIGSETQLGLALAWESGLANREAQGDVAFTD